MVRETRHLWVGNLPDNIREDRIREHFKRYGRVQSIKLLPRSSNNASNNNNNTTTSTNSSSSSTNNKEETATHCGNEGTMACTVAFMDIKSASKAHNAEHKLDDRTLTTEYYEPAAIPSAASPQNCINSTPSSAYSTSSPVSIGVGGGGGGGGIVGGGGVGTRFPNGHGSSDDHVPFSDRFYDRPPPTSRLVDSGDFIRRASGSSSSSSSYHGRSARSDRASVVGVGGVVGGTSTYRNGPSSYNSMMVERSHRGAPLPPPSASSLWYDSNNSLALPPQSTSISSSSLSSSNRYNSSNNSSSDTTTGYSSLSAADMGGGGGTTTTIGNSNNSTTLINDRRSQIISNDQSSTKTHNNKLKLITTTNTTTTTSSSTSITKSRSGSRSPSPSGSTSSRSPSSRSPRSRSTSSSSSSTTSTSRDTSSSSSEKRPVAIRVKNLPPRSSDSSLKDGLFHEYKKHGKVTWVKVVGQGSERYAIVCFKKPEDVDKALEVSHDKLFFGCKIDVEPYQGYDVEDNDLRPYEAEIDEFHPKATRTLFIGNLEKDITASDLRKHFDQFGEIIEIDIKKQGAVGSYAFCQYSDIVSVVKAIRTMDGEHLGNNRIKLGFGKSMPTNCVWVDGVVDVINEKYLRIQFEPFGSIGKVHVDRDKGQALIFYEQVSGAQLAVNKMRGFNLKGCKIQVDFASRECQESFFEHLDKQQGVGGVITSSTYDEQRGAGKDLISRSFEPSSNNRFSRYDTPTRPRTSSYSSRGSASSNQPPAVPSPGGTPGSLTPRASRSRTLGRYSDYYESATTPSDYADRHFLRNYDEYSQGSGASHEDGYDHDGYPYANSPLGVGSAASVIGGTIVGISHHNLDAIPSSNSDHLIGSSSSISSAFLQPDIRNLQKERVHLLEQLEELPSSGDELISPKKRLKLDHHHHLLESNLTNLSGVNSDVLIETTSSTRGSNSGNGDHHHHRKVVMEVRRLSDPNLLIKHHSRRPSMDALSSSSSSTNNKHLMMHHERTSSSSYLPHAVCKRRKTGGSDSGGSSRTTSHQQQHYDHHSGGESVGGSRPGTPLVDERPEHFQPSEPRRIPREREGPLTLPLPRFAAQIMNQRGSISIAGIKGQKDNNVLSSPPPAVTSPRISHLAAISAAAAAASTTPSSIISSSSSQTLSTAMKHESPSLSSHLVPPPASPPPRPSSLSSNSSSDSTPPSPSLDERIRSLDEKYEKWSGSRAATNVNCNNSSSNASTTIVVGSGNNSTCGGSSTSNNAITTSNLLINSTNLNSSSGTNSVNCLGGNNAVACGNDVLAKLDATREKFRLGHKLLDLDLKEVQPSDIVKSVMAKRSVFDEDLKRLENVGEKYEPKDFCGFTTTTTTTSSSSRTLTSTTSTASTTTLSLTITTTTNSSSGLTTSSATSSPLLAPSPSILKLTTTNLSGNVSSSGGVPPKTPTMLSPRSAGGANVTAAKGLQYPFPSHPPTTLSQQTLSPTPIVVTSTTTSTSSLLLASTTCNITSLTATTTTTTSKLITSSLSSSSSSSHGHGDTNRLKSCVTSGVGGGVNSVGGIISSENSNRTSNIHNNNNSKVMSVNKQTTIIKTSEKTSDTTSTPQQQQQQQIVKSSSDGNNSNNSGINKSDNNKILCRRDSNSNSPRNVGGGISSSSSNSSNSSTTGGEVIKSRRNSDATTIINKRISSDDNNSEIIMETKQQEQKPEKERNDKDTTIQKECEKEGKDDDSKSVVVELQAQQHPRKDNHEKSSSRHRHHSNDERSSKTKDNASIKENHNTPNDSSKSSRHLSIDFDRTKSSSYTDNKSLSSSSSDLSKRKERNNSLPSTPPSSGGLKRRLSTHESITNDNNGSSGVNDEKKLKLSNDQHHHHHNKRLSERRDSKDSQRSDDKSSSSKSSSGSSSKHKSTNSKSSSLSYNEDKQKIKDHQQQQDKHKQQKQMQKIEKHKIKSKSREKDLTPNSKESAAAASALSDKDFMARLDLRSNEEIDKQKRKDKDKLDQQQRYDEKKSTSSSLSDKKDRDKCKSNRSESESTTPKSLSSNNNDDLLQQQRNKIKKEHHQQQQQHQQQQNQQQQQQQQHHHHRIRKLTHNNSSDNSDSDEPKKHSIFDIVDDEPAYISMYDKVKARSCKNMQKQEEEKRQEKIKAKFSQLKQSRAKREEKKRSTSWDEDSDSDKDKMTTMNKSRSGKMCIMSSDEEETNSVISRKSTSSSHHHKKQMEIYTDSDSEQRQSKFKSSSSHHHHHHHHHHRITSDTSDDDMKKIQNQIKSEIFSDDNEIDQGFADSDDKLLYKSSQIKKEKNIKQESSTSLVEQMNAQIFGDSSSPDVKVEPTSNRYNNNNRHHENSSADENNMDIKKERSSSTSNSSEIRKKHKKKQKRQKYSLSSSEETTVTTPTMIKTENLDGTTIVNDENKSNKHHDKKKQHSKKDKKRDKSHSSTPKDERDKEKSSSSSSSLRKSKKNKDGTSSTLTKSESKRDGSKMENIFGSLSEDSEGGLKENELSENNKNYDRHHHKFETNYNSDSDREQRQQQQQDKTKIEEKEREAAAAAVAAAQAVAAKEEHRKRKEKKRREKERRLQEEAAAAAAAAAAATVQLLSEPINENSMDYADMGKQLEANIKDDSMEETSKINQDVIENTNSNTEDAFRFNSNDFADKKDDYHRSSKEAREKKKKRKKSKEEKQKHHHHHHHDKTKKSSSSSASSASIPSADVVVKKEFSEIKIEIDECKQQQPSLPNLDPSSPQPQNKSATSSNLDYSISPIPRDNVLLSPIPKTPTTTGSASNKEKKREKFIPGFGGTEIDEKIHENAIKSISEDFVDNSILSPTKHSSELLINQSIIDEVKPIQAATNNELLLSTTNEEKPRVVISQEETEDAVAALLGESFGGDNDNEQSQFTECYNQNDENLTSVEDNSQLNQIANENADEEEEVVVASQDDEEMRQAVQSLSSAVTPDTSSNLDDAKPETPQSEHELQIDTDTEECDENSLQTTTSTTTTTTSTAIISKSPGIIMEKSKTLAEINYLHHDKINNIGSPPSLAPITPKQDIIVETAKSLSLPLLPEQRSGVISQAPASTTTSTPPPFHLTEKKKDVEINKIVTPTTIVYPPLTAISPIPSKSVDIPEPIIVNKIVHNLPIVSAASTPPYVTKTLATVPPSQSTITTSSNLTPLATTTQINRLPITPIMVSKPMQAATVILSQPKIAVEQHQSMLVVSSPSSSLSTRIMSPITSTINTTCAITTPSQSVAIRMPPRTTFAYVPPYSSSSATIVGTKELDKVQNPTSNIIKQQTIIMATSTAAAPPAVVTPSISNVIKEAPPKLIGLNQQLQQQTSSAAAVIQQVKPQLIDIKESKIHEEHYHHHHHNLKVVDFASLHHKSTSPSPVIVQTATIINKEAPPIIENKLKDNEKDKIDDNIDKKLAIAQVTDELNLTLKKNDEIKTETKDEEEINKNVVGDNNIVENKIDDNDHSKEIKCEFKMEIKEERLFETKLEDKNKDWASLTKPQDKEVNIDSVIKTLCSSEDLTNKPSIPTINKEEWQMNESKPSQTELFATSESKIEDLTIKKEELVSNDNSANTPAAPTVPQTEQQQQQFVDDDQQHQDDVNKEIASTRGGRRGGRGARGRKSRASAGNCSERGGIQTRRGGKTLGAISTATSTTCSTVTTSTPCKQRGAGSGRGGTRPRGERKNSKSESETSTTPPAAASSDVYEFRDDSDDANNKERPRLILTIKSPAVASTNTPTSMQTTTTTSTAPVTAAILKDVQAKEIATTNITPVTTSISISSTLTTPTTTASGSLSKEASPVPSPAASIPSPAASIQSATSGSETKDEFLSPVANTRKSRRLQERDVLRNTVDDTIEDVVRNTVMVTRSSSSAQNAARRSARQAAAAGGKPTAAAGPTSSSPINALHNNNALMQQENLARKSPRSSTAAGGATIARRKDRRLSDPSLSHEDNSNDEKIKSDGLDANKSNEGSELKDTAESTGTSLVQATSALGKCEENKMEMLKDGFKGAMLRRVKSEMNNQQPVALIDPFTGELTPMHECEEGLYIPVPKSGSTTTASAATTKVVANESNTVITQSSSILHQPQQQQQIKSKPHSLKAHVLSSTVTVPQVQPKTVVAAIAAAPQTPHANPIVVVPQQPTTPLPVKKSIIVTQNLQQQQQQPINFNAAAAALKRQYTTVELLCGQDLPPHMKSQQQQQQSQQIVQKQQIVTSKPMIVSSAMVPQQQHQMINAQVGHLKLGNLSQQQQNIKQAVISKVKPTPILHGSTTNSPPSIGNAGKLVAGPIPGMVATPPPLPTPTSSLQQQNHIVVPPKIDVGNVILSGMKAKPVPPRQQQQYNFPSAPVTSLTNMQHGERSVYNRSRSPPPAHQNSPSPQGEAIAHFPGAVPLRPPPHDLPPAHYMHPSNVMQFPYLRQNYHLPRSPMVPAGAALLEKSDGQEGEEAPVTSPPLELRRPGSVGLALTAAARTTAVVPHSLHSPHDRTTDSPQIGQVYNMHTARMQPQHYHRYYDQAHPQQSAEPPPAHRPLTSHGSLTALATEAHMLGAPDRPLSSSMQQQQPDRPLSNLSAAIAHAHMSSLSGSAAAVAAQTTHLPPERPLSNHGLVTMGAGLGAAGNLMGAVARHVGVDAPASQRNLQAATPPHASQVPPQAESLFMLLKQYPCMWQGLLALKNDQAAVQMYFVSGNDMVAKCSLPRNMDGSTPPLRVFQRMRLEPPQVEGVARKMQMENEHCMLLALPCGHDHMDVLIQSMNLTNGFITYLQQKQAAGIVNVAAPGTTTPPAYVVHIFPSCDFVNTNLRRIAPSLLERVSDLAHLLIVITTV